MNYRRYWGKAGRQEDPGAYHPLVFHSLDVAACARGLLVRDSHLFRRLQEATRRGGVALDEVELLATVTFLVATHDLGKFSGRFQMLRPELARDLGLDLRRYPYDRRHDAIGAGFWADHVLAELLDEQALAVCTPDGELGEADCRDLLLPWISAVTGHHGLPPAPLGPDGEIDDQIKPDQRADAFGFVRDLLPFLAPSRLQLDCVPTSLGRVLAASSWILAGLTVAADWIGSNREWFPYETEPLALDRYWREYAQPRAEMAIDASRLTPSRPRSFPGFSALFSDIEDPSPLQRLVSEVALDPGPQLLLVEDQTGAGKTEAALTLASRLMDLGLADGLFFALPTMATANAMHRRVSAFHPRLFDDDGAGITYVLAHGSSRNVMEMERAESSADYDADDRDIASELRGWIGDSNKKALLAQVGVGTIDQALLCALRNKHSVLRLLGLHRHVLIVDEVHACDPYVARTLETLLEFQSMLGGSAILLSATLPSGLRQRLVAAFQKGLGAVARPPLEPSDEYPLLTIAAAEGEREMPCAARPGLERRVPVRFVHDEAAAVAYVLEQAREGRCVAWVRNTVRDALRAYDALTAELGPEVVELFHARFLLGDRLRIEGDVVSRFGKDSTPGQRTGRILVATQVVEQSLDIDFDAMLTDLAPIDLVIQRLGRLQRHARPGRPPAQLAILSPAWVDDPGAAFLSGVLAGTSRVYEDPGVLWRTLRCLRERGELDLPAQSRSLIEAVYCADPEIPEGLARAAVHADNKREASRGTAGFFALHPASGYRHEGACSADDLGAPTRLGEPTVNLRFARVVDGRLQPVLGSGRQAWALSSCRAPSRQVQSAIHAIDEESVMQGTEQMPDQGRGCVTFAVSSIGETRWTAEGRRSDGRTVRIDYDSCRGLAFRVAGTEELGGNE